MRWRICFVDKNPISNIYFDKSLVLKYCYLSLKNMFLVWHDKKFALPFSFWIQCQWIAIIIFKHISFCASLTYSVACMHVYDRGVVGWWLTARDDVMKWKHFPRYWPFVRGIHRSPGEVPAQRPVTRSFDVFFALRLNKRLSKQSWGWWFETPSRLLWRHHNDQDIVGGLLFFLWHGNTFCFTDPLWMPHPHPTVRTIDFPLILPSNL